MVTKNNKNKMVLAIDIETSGPRLSLNGIVSVGCCLGDLRGNTVAKNRFDFKLEKHQVFDSDCTRQFWSRIGPKRALQTIQNSQISPKLATAGFAALLDTYDTDFDLTIITDNPGFDLYFLNYYFDKYLGRKPINYKMGNKYRPIIDSTSYVKGAMGKYYKNKKHLYFNDIKHDHLPDNDAEFIYKCYMKYRL